jgi:hypothetical protein
MSRVDELEKQIRRLTPEELAEFRRWFSDYDAEAWDRQFESDVKAGRLDDLAQRALRAHESGESTLL